MYIRNRIIRRLISLRMGAHLSSPRTEKTSTSGGDFKNDFTIFGSTSMQGWRISMEDAHMTIPNILLYNNLSKLASNRELMENTNEDYELLSTTRDTSTPYELLDLEEFNGEGGPETMHVLEEEKGMELEEDKKVLFNLLNNSNIKGSIYGVFDGHGGNSVSKWVSENFSNIYKNELNKLVSNVYNSNMNLTSINYYIQEKRSYENVAANDPDTQEEEDVDRQNVVLYLVSKSLENCFLKLDEYLSTPQVDVQLHNINSMNANNNLNNNILENNNLFKVLLPDKMSNRQHALDLIQQLTLSYNTNSNNLYPNNSNNAIDNTTMLEDSEQESVEDENETRDMETEKQEVSLGEGEGLQTSEQSEEKEEGEEEEEEDNKELYAMGCGATSVVAVILEEPFNYIVVANAGDSRCVLSRNKVAIPLSVDHKPTDEVELDRIRKAGGNVINGRVDGNLNLSRSLGDLSFKLDKSLNQKEQKITSFPDIQIIKLNKSDEFLVLACDGIWDCKSNQQVVDFVNTKYTYYSSNTRELQRDESLGGREGTRKEEKKMLERRKSDELSVCKSTRSYSRELVLEEKVEKREELPLPEKGNDRKILERICEELCDVCLSNNPSESEGIGCDNMTVIIVKFNGESVA